MLKLVGQKFGRLVVIQRVNNNKQERTQWLCQCDCGEKITVVGDSLKRGNTKSCGCYQKEQLIERLTTHGHAKQGGSKTYRVWTYMIHRCTNPKDKRYQDYGGRGITVCERWRNSFENFLEDMGQVPEGYQIDRIDNNGNYCKTNCRWATRQEQMRNTRRNFLISYNDKTQCLASWAEELNMNYSTLKRRLYDGWSISRAFTTPARKYQKGKKHYVRT